MARTRAGVRRKPIKRMEPGGRPLKPKRPPGSIIGGKAKYPGVYTHVKPKKKPTIKTSKPKRPPKRVTRRKVR